MFIPAFHLETFALYRGHPIGFECRPCHALASNITKSLLLTVTECDCPPIVCLDAALIRAAEGLRTPRRWRDVRWLPLNAKRLGVRLSFGAPGNRTVLLDLGGERYCSQKNKSEKFSKFNVKAGKFFEKWRGFFEKSESAFRPV